MPAFTRTIDWRIVARLAFGQPAGDGADAAGAAATRVPDAVLRFVLAGTLILAGSKLIF